MKIPLYAGKSLREFVKSAVFCGEQQSEDGRRWKVLGTAAPVAAPAECPQSHCGAKGAFHRHGSYARQVVEGLVWFLLLIYRFRCKECGKTVSRPYSFLMPYRRFTAEIVGRAIAAYAAVETTYHDLSIDLSVYEDNTVDKTSSSSSESQERCCPARSTIFAWVDFACKRVSDWILRIVRAAVNRGKLQVLPHESQLKNPNSYKAGKSSRYWHQKFKPKELSGLTYSLVVGALLFGQQDNIVRDLREYFLSVPGESFDLLSDVSTSCQ